jgi:signal recognition particle receptor subunit beta
LAVLDPERNAVVIRIVYDGPPEAGKTTSLRALSESLARPMDTPAAANGRTLYFDYLEYTGGLFEGHQIRCQLITVPGQTVLARRRRALLSSADVVVFVSDSTTDAVATTREYMTEMRQVLDRIEGPRVGVIVQANHRDRENAVDLATLRAAFPEDGVAVFESVATEGRGVRDVFVFAVRLALDRVRELLRTRSLPVGAPEIQNSGELLEHLQRADAAPQVLRDVLQQELATMGRRDVAPRPKAAAKRAIPRLPHPDVPSGSIWPPVEGRMLLLDACAESFAPQQNAHGDWTGETKRWRFHSPRQASYSDPELGRAALIEWARIHASGQRWFSSPRVVVLSDGGDGTWRLWQIVKIEESLRDLVRAGEGSPAMMLRRLLDAGRLLFRATERLTLAPCRLPISIDTVGARSDQPLYIGVLPEPFLARAPHPISAEHRPTLLRRELGALAAAELRRFGGEDIPSLRSIVHDGDARAVIDAVEDVLRDAGLYPGSMA